MKLPIVSADPLDALVLAIQQGKEQEPMVFTNQPFRLKPGLGRPVNLRMARVNHPRSDSRHRKFCT
jgi:hypothetical protein